MKAREAALRALLHVYGQKGRKGPLVDSNIRFLEGLEQKERALAERLFKGVLEKDISLEGAIRRVAGKRSFFLDVRVRAIMKLGLYQLFYMDKIPDHAAISETVELAKGAGSKRAGAFVNWFLRQAQRLGPDAFSNISSDLLARLSTEYSMPHWLLGHFERELGRGLEPFLKATVKKGPLVLRVNSLKISREMLISLLRDLGMEAEEGRYSPYAVVVRGHKFGLIKEQVLLPGLAQVQSEASQLAAHILDPRPGEQVLDLCSGLGTKAMHMAQLMEDQGRIVCMDINLERLKLLIKEAKRLSLSILHPVCADIKRGLTNMLRQGFDKVLLDAPCSNLGSISKRPDIKIRMSPGKMEELSRLQQELLGAATEVLRPGGLLLYVTCTISRKENQDNIGRLLLKMGDMELVNLGGEKSRVPQGLLMRDGFLFVFPHLHGTEAFFFALLRKKGTSRERA